MTVEVNKFIDQGKEYIVGFKYNCSIKETLTITQALLLLSMDETAHEDDRKNAENLRNQIILGVKI